jgi:hypothetical protein
LVAISTVGVVEKPKSMTSIPRLTKVFTTNWLTILPDILPSRPTTILAGNDLSCLLSAIMLPNEAVNLTISIAVKDSPGFPPIVPLMPEMLLINATKTVLILPPIHGGKGVQKYGFNISP